ncbi:MAG: hypothetical protein E7447_05335 [Ruminococcaceae bacterium]|nr:hypothetical protein [Oscillospiraceae bacterium]
MKKHRMLTAILLLGFILGVHEGKVALWKEGIKNPIKVFPYQASQLPEEDQKRLEQGVRVESISQLKKLIEDYFS